MLICAISAHALSIALSKTTYYSGAGISLKDIASVSDASAAVRERIASEIIPVRSPLLHIIPQRAVREIVSAFESNPIITTGNRVFAIVASASESEKILYTQLLDFIDSESGSRESRIEVSIEDEIPSAWFASDDSFQFRFQGKKTKMGLLDGLQRIEFMLPSGITERFRVNIRSFVQVITATSQIEKYELLTWAKLGVKEVPVESLASEALGPGDAIARLSAKTRIQTDMPVFRRQVEQAFDVRARDPVRIQFHNRSIWLTMTGTASESGAIGDTVKVKPDDSTEVFKGRITGMREVTIDVFPN
jgi:flagella basal body P-ring formation protein FlgA